jgi:hypothetical protein
VVRERESVEVTHRRACDRAVDARPDLTGAGVAEGAEDLPDDRHTEEHHQRPEQILRDALASEIVEEALDHEGLDRGERGREECDHENDAEPEPERTNEREGLLEQLAHAARCGRAGVVSSHHRRSVNTDDRDRR